MHARQLPNMHSSNMRGGKRQGAGRKHRPVAREALTLRVEPEVAERFRKLCEAKGRSQSEQFTAMVKHARVMSDSKIELHPVVRPLICSEARRDGLHWTQGVKITRMLEAYEAFSNAVDDAAEYSGDMDRVKLALTKLHENFQANAEALESPDT